MEPPEECAQCGTAIPRRARACPGCGADERTGWRETSVYDGLDLPENEPERPAARRGVNGLAWYWWCVGVFLALTFGLGALALLR